MRSRSVGAPSGISPAVPCRRRSSTTACGPHRPRRAVPTCSRRTSSWSDALPFLLLVVGYREETATVPDIGRKPLDEIVADV